MKKRLKFFFAPILICLTMIFGAMSVSASDLSDADLESLKEQVAEFIMTYVSYDNETLEGYASYDDVYQTMCDVIEDTRPDTGNIVAVNDVTYSVGDNAITFSADCDFEKLDAEVILYISTDGTTIMNMVINVDYPLGTKMLQALSNFAIGIIIVFVILVFLAFIISLFKFISPKAKEKKAAAQQSAPAKAPAKPAAAPAAAPAPQQDDTEIIAVIAAAIAAAEADLGPAAGGDGYVVRSIRKVSGKGNWKRA